MQHTLILVCAIALCAVVSAQPAGIYLVSRTTLESDCPVNRSIYVSLSRMGTEGGACSYSSSSAMSTYRTCNSTHRVTYSCPTTDCSGACTVASGTSGRTIISPVLGPHCVLHNFGLPTVQIYQISTFCPVCVIGRETFHFEPAPVSLTCDPVRLFTFKFGICA